jgi:hypothetical protein
MEAIGNQLVLGSEARKREEGKEKWRLVLLKRGRSRFEEQIPSGRR